MVSIDLMTAEQFGALRLLEAIHREFPLDKVMPPDFKGTHTLCLNRKTGRLQLNVWVDNHVWPLTFTGEFAQPPRTTLPQNFPPVEAIIAQRGQ